MSWHCFVCCGVLILALNAIGGVTTTANSTDQSSTTSKTSSEGKLSNVTTGPNETQQTASNSTESNNGTSGLIKYFGVKTGPVMRAFVVGVGITAIVLVYFIIRAVRLRRRRSKSLKYGVIAKSGDLEMTPLDQDDDEDDMTVFEASNNLIRK